MTVPSKNKDYKNLISNIFNIVNQARHICVHSINSTLIVSYWNIGQRIVKFEQAGNPRATYGKEIIKSPSKDLQKKLGRGFSERNLRKMRKFYLLWPENWPTVSANSILSWSHYTRLMTIEDADTRKFYETESLRGGWSYRQLDRQINSQFYERILLSKNKVTMLKKAHIAKKNDLLTPEEEIKDPTILEFLDLKDEYSESDLEEALINKLEDFLLELGNEFTFVGRQKRLRIGNEWYRIDLLLYHRKLRCLIIVDLKIGKFTHSDVGQMNLYLNYAKEHMLIEGENAPIGLILSADRDDAIVHYAMGGLENKMISSKYKLLLPNEKKIKQELIKAQLEFKK
ncbi:YhcG family protein [bacterium]